MDCYKVDAKDGAEKTKDQNARSISTTTMAGAWTNHAFKLSNDGKSMVIHTQDGLDIVQGGARQSFKLDVMNRELFWSPDNSKFVLWTRDGVSVVDLNNLGTPGGKLSYKTVYTAPPGHFPYGFEWSPHAGNELYIVEFVDTLENKRRQIYSSVMRFSPGSNAPKEIIRHPTKIDFFMPPVSRFQHGTGVSNRAYGIVYGTTDGLYLVDRDGKNKERLTDVPCVGLQNLEWSPGTKDKIVLFFRRPEPSPKGEILKGVYLIHVDRRNGPEKEQVFENLYPGLDVHTLWFSSRGKWVTWATVDAVYFREPDAKSDTLVKIEPKDDKGLFMEVKGCAWNKEETKLAIAANDRLMVYEVAKKTLVTVAQFGNQDGKSFAAEPSWIDDQVYCSVFTDVSGGKAARDKKPGK